MISEKQTALAAIVALALQTGSAVAAPRYSVWNMSCAQAQAVVNAQGAVVMYTAQPNAYGPETYDRLVRNASYCGPTEIVEPLFAKSRDQAQCPVAFKCVPAPPRSLYWR